MWPDSSSSINACKMADRVADFLTLVLLLLFSGSLVDDLLTENRAQNEIEYHQIVLSYSLGNEAKRNADKWRGSRKDRDGLLVPRTRT